MKRFKEFLLDDAVPINVVGSGAIAGTGYSPSDPPVDLEKARKKQKKSKQNTIIPIEYRKDK